MPKPRMTLLQGGENDELVALQIISAQAIRCNEPKNIIKNITNWVVMYSLHLEMTRV
jgi:hypothetical protein